MSVRRAFALTRISLSALGVLAMSVQCGVPLEAEPLHRFETCDDLEAYLYDQLLHPRVQTRAPAGATGVLGCAADAVSAPGGEESLQRDANESATSDGASPAPREFTETNTQEQDVDEADFVKSDGEHLYVLRRGELLIVDAWPASEAHVLSRTRLVSRGFTMFLDGDRALVAGRADDTVRAPWGGSVVLELYDLSDRSAPRLLREVQVDGAFVDARRVDDEVLLVMRTRLDWPQLSRAPFKDDENRAVLEDTGGVAAALPGVRDLKVEQGQLSDGLAFHCENTYAPDTSDGSSLVVVHTLSMHDEQAALKSTGVVGDPELLYASAESVYLVDIVWSDGGYFTPDFAKTRLHKLRAFSGSGAAEYVATGTFDGRPHDQFSFDEEEGRLRAVLTTNGSASGAPEANRSSLLVIEEQGVELLEVGRVDDIGDEEFVQAVRFLGDFAYVVTYPLAGGELEVPPGMRIPPPPANGIWDPLFVIDLTNPTEPRMRGELEVAGYSTYIHPLGDEHLLTIGVDSDETGAVLGMHVSVFDVSDKDAPALAHREAFGDGLSFSEALSDHHAFTFFESRGVLALPLQLTDANNQLTSTGLELFHVDAEEGITPWGSVEQLPLFGGHEIPSFEGGCAAVRRSAMIAEGEQAYVYAFSTGGLTVASLEEGLPMVAELPLLGDGEALCPLDTPL